MIWQLKEKAPEDFMKQFPEYPDFVLNLLWHREIKSQKGVDDFFNPDYEINLHNPFLMKGMEKAVRRLEKTIADKEKIVIYGDYDTDGICASAILYETFKILGVGELDVYIPDRFKEGYGLNPAAVKEIAQGGAKVLITVDCGITDVSEVELANSLGLDVIITDHHLVHDDLPRASVIIDVRQKDDSYPFKWLTGAGVAFKLVQALLERRRETRESGPPPGWEKWLLDLVALATIADMPPLLEENRTLVRYGLIVLEKTRRPGLKELFKISGLQGSALDAWKVGFLLTPRLNAAGRINHADISFRLLTTDSLPEAQDLARRLDLYNQERQKLVDGIIREIKAGLNALIAAGRELPKLIFETSALASAGTTGLVAGKLTDEYHRPAMVCAPLEDEFRGTGRSIPTFNLVRAMEECVKNRPDLLVEFGGHAMAAGFTVKKEKLPVFRELLQKIAGRDIKEDDLAPRLDIDLEISPQSVNWELYDWMMKFEPFGENNKRPLFLARGLEVGETRIVGNGGKHLKLKLRDSGGKSFNAIGFGLAENGKNLAAGSKIDVVFELAIDEWNGNRELQLKIVDLKPEN